MAMNTPPHSGTQRRRRQPHATRTHQHGLALIGVVTLMLALMFMALALDAGRLWLERRNLQKAADIAALESSRFTGCGSSELDARSSAQRAMMANGVGLSPGTVTMASFARGQISRDALKLPVFTPIAGASDLTNATQVKLVKPVAASMLLGGLFGEKVNIQAEALAQGGPPVATFAVGSYVGVTQKQADLLTKIFGAVLGNSSLNLTLSAMQALATSTITLVELQAAAGAKSIDDLLNMRVPASQLLQWIAQSTTLTPEARAALQQIVSASVSSGLQVRIGDVFSVQVPTNSGVAQASINVLDLVNTSLVVGYGSNLINLSVGLAGIGSVKIGFLNPPKIAVGPAGKSVSGQWCTEARSAQMSLVVGINPLNLGLVDMALRLDLASTNANLHSVTIAAGNTKGVIGAGQTIMALKLTRSNDASKPASVFAGLLTVGLNLPLLDGQGGTANFTVKSRDDMPKGVPTSGVAGSTIAGLLGADTSLDIRVLGLGGDLLKPVVQLIVTPILTLVGEGIIDPLLSALGIDFGIVKVQILDIKSPVLILRQ